MIKQLFDQFSAGEEAAHPDFNVAAVDEDMLEAIEAEMASSDKTAAP